MGRVLHGIRPFRYSGGMADNEQPKPSSTHLIHYANDILAGTVEMTFLSGYTAGSHTWTMGWLAERYGPATRVTGVTTLDQPTLNTAALKSALSGLADTLDAGASPAKVAEGLRQMVRVIK
jgi:hypothetical protein